MKDYSNILINASAPKIMQAVLRAKARQEGKTDTVIICRDITAQCKPEKDEAAA